MKKGFTLIEMLAVVTILALIALLVLPTILNQVADKKEEISDVTKKMIISAAELYASETEGYYQTITLNDLIKDGKLEDPMIDHKTGKEIPLTKEISIDSSGNACIVGMNGCSKITYKKYENGETVYFDPTTGKKCNAENSISTPGTKTGCMKWYAFNDSKQDSKVSLLLDHNTTAILQNYFSTGTDYGSPTIVHQVLDSDTKSWNDKINIRQIKKEDLVKILGTSKTDSSSTDEVTLNYFVTVNNGLINSSGSSNTNCDSIKSHPNGWLLANLDLYSGTGGFGRGYWTDDLEGVYLVRIDSQYGYKGSYDQALKTGIRPVITVPKYMIA